MSENIQPHHLSRLAVVYVRQSSPTQFRNQLESPQRQRALRERAMQLGWSESRVHVLAEQQAASGGSTHGRPAYRELSEQVAQHRVGLILAVEVARWARDNAAWQWLLRDCIFEGVLLADEQRLYDPNDPHDHVLLGIQGALAEYELRMLRTRTITCWWNKAKRHEMHIAIPTGVVATTGHLEKHPHRRVRNSFDRLFRKFDECASVLQLCRWYLEKNELLPYVAHGDHPHQVQWRPAAYKRLLGILKNPTYAGAYVIGRSETIRVRNEQGEIVRRRCAVPQEKWKVVDREHFDGYISWQQYEQNMRKIQNNTWRQQSPGRRGSSLLSGLLRCARCGTCLHVQYHGSHPSYVCRGGARQRERGRLCLSFSGRTVEPLFAEMVLEAVRPAALAASRQAFVLLREQSQQDRQTLLDHLEQLQYESERARRQYDRVEPENRLVAEELERRWNEALQALDVQRMCLEEFDRQHPPTALDESLEAWFNQGCRLEEAWHAPSSEATLKKQIVDLLVREVVVELSDSGEEVQLWIHWQGGHHTLLSAPRSRGRGGGGRQTEARRIVSLLRAAYDDASIARTLNRHGIHMPETSPADASSWTAKSVRVFRERHAIAPFDAAEKARRGLLTGEEAGCRLGISAMSVHRLIAAGTVPAEQPRRGLPSIILERDLELPEVQAATQRILANRPRPLPENPSQQFLF
jgi:DNA invertase Pin-like site-specific DNA recombinase